MSAATESKTPEVVPIAEVPGLYYYPELISTEAERRIIEFLESGENTDRWKKAGVANRQVIHFGYNYPYNRALKLTASYPIPDLIQTEVIEPLRSLPQLTDYEPDQAIINRYLDKEGIGKHTDHKKLFDDRVVSVTLGTGAEMVFRHAGKTPVTVFVEPRSGYLMSGPARWDWTHEMSKSRRQDPRYSVTFRNVMNEYIEGPHQQRLEIYGPPGPTSEPIPEGVRLISPDETRPVPAVTRVRRPLGPPPPLSVQKPALITPQPQPQPNPPLPVLTQRAVKVPRVRRPLGPLPPLSVKKPSSISSTPAVNPAVKPSARESSTKVTCVRVKDLRPQYDNLKEWMADPQNVYIGRRGVVLIESRRFPEENSPFANPFKVGEGKDGTRDEVIQKYKDFILAQIAAGELTRSDFEGLQGKVLGCWCKPDPCHGDVLVEILQNLDQYFPEN